jgi:hypothetical protein
MFKQKKDEDAYLKENNDHTYKEKDGWMVVGLC